MDAIRCPRCAKQIPDTSSFCRRCGSAIHARRGTATKRSPKPASNAPAIAIFACLFGAAVAAAVIFSIRSNTQATAYTPAVRSYAPVYTPPMQSPTAIYTPSPFPVGVNEQGRWVGTETVVDQFGRVQTRTRTTPVDAFGRPVPMPVTPTFGQPTIPQPYSPPTPYNGSGPGNYGARR